MPKETYKYALLRPKFLVEGSNYQTVGEALRGAGNYSAKVLKTNPHMTGAPVELRIRKMIGVGKAKRRGALVRRTQTTFGDLSGLSGPLQLR
jgi:hypothetical protein